MTTDVNEFLMSGGAPSVKFDSIGKRVTGVILAMELRNDTDPASGTVKTWDDGTPQKLVLITLQTEEHDPGIDEDDGARSVWARGGMLNAIRAVARPYRGLNVGGQLAVQYVGDGTASRKGFAPPKLYKAWYKPPADMPVESIPATDPDDVPF